VKTGWERRLNQRQHPFPALQESIDEVFDQRIGDVSGRGKLAADMREIEEGAFSNGITPRGKGGPLAPLDARQGINSYSSWFANDHDMSGDYFGYDGPCPPWNDSLVHRYVFTLYALDVHTLNLQGSFTGEDALRAMQKHVLAKASLTGTYTLNPKLAPKQIGATSA
jgi:Raf kinase inhibitor-like YbhB/YbcL family protein